MFKALVTTLTLVFNAGTLVLLFFIILGGAFDLFPLNHFFWFSADTSNISGAPKRTRWTLWGYCDEKDGKNSNCSKNKPAFAFQPDRTFKTKDGIPKDIIENHDTYYYLTRFAFPFYLIGLFFTLVSFLLGFLGYLSRLGAALSSAISFISFLFVAAASACITACYVMAKDKMKDGKLGVKLIAFTWTATALTLLCLIGYCCGWHRNHKQSELTRGSSFNRAGSKKRGGFFNVNKNQDDEEFVKGGETGSQNPVMAPVSSYERGGGL